ncbi:MAG: hypothetical protein ACNA7E_11035, partial [Wenzhouxiangellaceae bacterium]
MLQACRLPIVGITDIAPAADHELARALPGLLEIRAPETFPPGRHGQCNWRAAASLRFLQIGDHCLQEPCGLAAGDDAV